MNVVVDVMVDGELNVVPNSCLWESWRRGREIEHWAKDESSQIESVWWQPLNVYSWKEANVDVVNMAKQIVKGPNMARRGWIAY